MRSRRTAAGTDRPNTIADPRGWSTTACREFFNTAAFAPQPLGTIGNTQRNSLFGPHFRHVDLSLFKNFPVTERVNMQFRVETYNISNTPNFFIANNNSSNQEFGNASFGTVSATDPNYIHGNISSPSNSSSEAGNRRKARRYRRAFLFLNSHICHNRDARAGSVKTPLRGTRDSTAVTSNATLLSPEETEGRLPPCAS